MAIYTDLSPRGAQYAFSSSRQDNAIGVVLPFGKAEDGTFFKQSFTTLEAAKSNIKNLILTMRGERIMHPTLGSNLWNFIMDPQVGEEFETQIKTTIKENIKMWLPYINVEQMTVNTNEGNNSVEIAMSISLKNDPRTIETLYFSISKGDV